MASLIKKISKALEAGSLSGRETNDKPLKLEGLKKESLDKKTKDLTLRKGLEYEKYMRYNHGRLRDSMPQISPDNLDDYIIHFADKAGGNNKGVKKVRLQLKDIKPTQIELNNDKIQSHLDAKNDSYKKRWYIISKDKYLVDGHHSWANGLEINPNTYVNAYMIALPIQELLRRSNLLKISKKKDINDNEVKKAYDLIMTFNEKDI